MEIKIPIELPDDWYDKVAEKLIKKGDAVLVIRCKDCKWFGKIGCAIKIVDESDKPKENDFCSYAEPKEIEGK